jgi:MSHA biogenesis protein MshE
MLEGMDSIEHEWVPIGTLLLRSGLIDAEQLELALGAKEESGQRLGELLTSWGWVSSRDIALALAEQFQLPFRDLDQTPAAIGTPHPLTPPGLQAVTLEITDDHIEIGVDDPTNIAAIEELRDSLDKPIKLAVIDPGALRATAHLAGADRTA